MLKDLLISIRPKQWYKNFVIFIGIIFSANLFNVSLWPNVIFAFISFCLLSGVAYIINDVIDKKNDQKHPKKCNRPIASGRLKVTYALIFSLILLIISLLISFSINLNFFYISLIFIFVNIFYSIILKHIAIVDVLTISANFVIRAEAGCLAINAPLSPWLTLCAFLLALFLALGKRKHEMILLKENKTHHRKSLENYSFYIIDQMIISIASALIISYSLYTFFSGKLTLMLTIPIVIYSIFRFLFLIETKNIGDEPQLIFKDKNMIFSILIWIIMVVSILYLYIPVI